MIYDMTFCSNFDCTQHECQRHQVNMPSDEYMLSISGFECKNMEKCKYFMGKEKEIEEYE